MNTLSMGSSHGYEFRPVGGRVRKETYLEVKAAMFLLSFTALLKIK